MAYHWLVDVYIYQDYLLMEIRKQDGENQGKNYCKDIRIPNFFLESGLVGLVLQIFLMAL
jgi:hypothetical protein